MMGPRYLKQWARHKYVRGGNTVHRNILLQKWSGVECDQDRVRSESGITSGSNRIASKFFQAFGIDT